MWSLYFVRCPLLNFNSLCDLISCFRLSTSCFRALIQILRSTVSLQKLSKQIYHHFFFPFSPSLFCSCIHVGHIMTMDIWRQDVVPSPLFLPSPRCFFHHCSQSNLPQSSLEQTSCAGKYCHCSRTDTRWDHFIQLNLLVMENNCQAKSSTSSFKLASSDAK